MFNKPTLTIGLQGKWTADSHVKVRCFVYPSIHLTSSLYRLQRPLTSTFVSVIMATAARVVLSLELTTHNMCPFGAPNQTLTKEVADQKSLTYSFWKKDYVYCVLVWTCFTLKALITYFTIWNEVMGFFMNTQFSAKVFTISYTVHTALFEHFKLQVGTAHTLVQSV